ncbi:hypothetical protein UACE39S_06690 [Ureibacillus acetophenoni]
MKCEDVARGPPYAEEDQTLTYENGKYTISYKNKTIR